MTKPFAAQHYAERAQDYVASPVHNQGTDLDAIKRMVAGKSLHRVLDLGCGGGHVAYTLAPRVREVIAADPTPPMLDRVRQEADRLGLPNITTVEAPAERLPFETGTFDAIICRFTTHHWEDAAAGLREARRILAPTGFALFIDVTAPGTALANTWLQTLELLRDISHVRNYTLPEWTSLLEQAGFTVRQVETHTLRMEFTSWTTRTQTPPERIAAIRSLQQAAPPDVTRRLAIEPDGSFTLDVATFLVR